MNTICPVEASRRERRQQTSHRESAFVKVPAPSGRCEKIDFAEIWLDAKCMPMTKRSLIGDPGEISFVAELTSHLLFNFFTSSCPPKLPSGYSEMRHKYTSTLPTDESYGFSNSPVKVYVPRLVPPPSKGFPCSGNDVSVSVPVA
jgi:hypothetical protein